MARIDADLDPCIGLQGNLDPFTLYGPQDVIKEKVTRICQAIQSDRPFIFNLGHGLMPDSPIDSVQCVVDTVRSHTKTAALT